MPTQSQVSDQLRALLAISDPDLDTSIGTTPRKMIDVFAEVIAEASIDRYLLDYIYDVDAKIGADLDDFVENFGITRLPPRRASGEVTFERNTPSLQNVFIPQGSQVSTADVVPITFATVVPAVLPAGQLSIVVPVICVNGGSLGNVTAGGITRRGSGLDGISSFMNVGALSGGVDPESDTALRLRFKRTVFRNMAGTESMFLGVALEPTQITQANVVGASKRHREQIHIISGTATSTIADAASIYAGSSIFGPSLDNGEILKETVHYSFNAGVVPPVVTSLDAVTTPDGIYDLEFEYVPNASRNSPAQGITNRVDIYVYGQRIVEAIETAVFNTAKVFTTGSGTYQRTKFKRRDETVPVANNYFVPFAFAPVVDPSVSNSLVIGGHTFTENTDYWLVNDITNQGMGARSLSGIEFRSAANGGANIPANGTKFQADYTYDASPLDVMLALEQWRLVTQDVMIHAAKPIRLNLFFAAILSPGYTLSGVQTDVYNTLATYISSIGFDNVLQVSDLLAIAHAVPGVDAIRFLTSADDAVNYAIQRVNVTGALISTYDNGGTPKRAIDVFSDDDEVPLLNSIAITQRAQNSFGAV